VPILVAIVSYLSVGTDLPYGWLLFFLFLMANSPFIYTLSFLFSKDSSGGTFVALFFLAFGWLAAIIVGILQVIPSTMKFARYLRFVFMVIPIYSLDYGIINITGRGLLSIVNQQYTGNWAPLSWEIALPQICFLVFDFFFYWGLLIAIEKGAFHFLKRSPPKVSETDTTGEDEDIGIEARRVQNEELKDIPVRVKNLRKTFPPTTSKGKPVLAVDRVSFGLEYGECFALLGVSGAGKTTTFKCLTGEEQPTEGLASILGNNLANDEGFEKARKMIGYCP